MSSYLIQVYARYIFYLCPRKRRKDYYIVYSVKEFRGKGVFHFFHYSLLQIPNRRSFRQETQRPCKFFKFIASKITCHNNNCIAEIYPLAPAVCKPPFIKDLQEKIEHIGVRLFYFIQQNHCIRSYRVLSSLFHHQREILPAPLQALSPPHLWGQGTAAHRRVLHSVPSRALYSTLISLPAPLPPLSVLQPVYRGLLPDPRPF